MIYTTYLSNLKNLPNDDMTKKYLITRWKPRNTIDVKKYNLEWAPQLAPTELTLAKRKDGSIDWREFRQRYINESFDFAITVVLYSPGSSDVIVIPEVISL